TGNGPRQAHGPGSRSTRWNRGGRSVPGSGPRAVRGVGATQPSRPPRVRIPRRSGDLAEPERGGDRVGSSHSGRVSASVAVSDTVTVGSRKGDLRLPRSN